MWTEILRWLDSVDKTLFVLINYTWHVSWLDHFMLLMRNPLTWAPLYAIVFYWMYRNQKNMVIPFVMASVLTFAITDYTSASILKPIFERLRPCYDPALISKINIIDGCGGQYSMPSSHASNHFGLATVWFWLIWFLKGIRWNWVWFWAVIICYAQIYTGKHFPLDIAGGALLGIFSGTCMAKLFKYWYTNGKRKFWLFSLRQHGHTSGH